MIENIEKFYKLLSEDSSVAKRLADAQNAYPGSWEIREPFLQATMLPLAEELGLGFTIEELRKYETRLKVMNSRDIDDESDSVPEPVIYQLLDHGWETASSVYEDAEESFRNK
ncbi:MAG: hypothetical protein IJJ22_02645 [Oscillospiraceae bacterium]|nr:hypothetical protein [Oscillospiraceae bacterium]